LTTFDEALKNGCSKISRKVAEAAASGNILKGYQQVLMEWRTRVRSRI